MFTVGVDSVIESSDIHELQFFTDKDLPAINVGDIVQIKSTFYAIDFENGDELSRIKSIKLVKKDP
jgi:uncharacterized protein YpmB